MDRAAWQTGYLPERNKENFSSCTLGASGYCIEKSRENEGELIYG
jgi:hypothetical protein